MKSSNKVLISAVIVLFACLLAVFVYTKYFLKTSDETLTGVIPQTIFNVDAKNQIVGKASMDTMINSVSDFNRIFVKGWANVVIKHGDKNTVSITTNKNLFPYIQHSVKGKRLTVGDKDNYNLRPQQAMKITIVTKSMRLSRLFLAGRIHLKAADLSGDHFVLDAGGKNIIDLSGTVRHAMFNIGGITQLKFCGMHAQSMVYHVGGYSHLDLCGKVDNLLVKVGGNTTIMAKQLMANHFSLTGAGMTDATVNVQKSIHVMAFGKVNLKYYGNPTTVDKTDFGDIKVQKLGS